MTKLTSVRVACGLAATAVALLPSFVAAQTTVVSKIAARSINDKVVAARANAPIRVDGRLDEPVWHAVKPANYFVQRSPSEGAAPSLPTEVRMILSDDAVIFGVRLHDDFAAIVRPVAARSDDGETSYVDDYFQIQIDPHREHLSALVLTIAPSGGRKVAVIGRDGTLDDSWDIRWDAATRVDADGWSAEIRIPLSEFHVKPGTEEWGVQFTRYSARRQETDVFKFGPSVSP